MAISSELARRLLRLTGAAAAALVLIGLVGALSLHAYGSYRLDRARAEFDAAWGHLTSVPVPPDFREHENGARWLAAGGFALVWSLDDQKFIGELSGRSTKTWTDTDVSRARWILHEQQNALSLLLRSGTFEKFHIGAVGEATRHDQIPLIDIIKGLRLLTVEARLAWHEGRTADCLAALGAVGRASDGLMKTTVVISSYAGAAAMRWAASGAAEIVTDPCAEPVILEELRTVLPVEDPTYWADKTMATQVAEIATEGLDYIEDFHDPSVGWSLPFWVLNRYLLEDLFVAQILDRWNRYLEVGQGPAADWPERPGDEIWGDAAWPPWLALAGSITPNMLSGRAQAQAASTEMQQLLVALDLRLAAPAGLESDACGLVDLGSPTALTGEAVTCRYDVDLAAIVIEVGGAEGTLESHTSAGNHNSRFRPVVIPVGRRAELCE
jgi:hypothetical protein